MALTHKTTMAADAQARVLAQYRELPLFMALIGELAGNVQTVEDAFWDLYEAPRLATGTGIWLDYIGEIVGEKRDGETDDDVYRRYINARIVANKSNGTIDDILMCIRAILDDDLVTITFTENYPAAITIEIGEDFLIDYTDAVKTRLMKMLRFVRAIGIYLQAMFQSHDDAHTFTFSSGTTLEADVYRGMGDTTDPLIGGFFRDVEVA